MKHKKTKAIGVEQAMSNNPILAATKAALDAARITTAAADIVIARQLALSGNEMNQLTGNTSLLALPGQPQGQTSRPSRSPSRRVSSNSSLAKSQSQSTLLSARRDIKDLPSARRDKDKDQDVAFLAGDLEALMPLTPHGNSHPHTAAKPEVVVEVFPKWMRERKDFQVYFPRFADHVITDEDILKQGIPKEPMERNIVELQCLARWIMRIPLMRALDLSQATEIAKLSRHMVFQPGEFVFRKGDVGDACYIIFAGEVHVLIDGAKVASFGRNCTFGDIALQMENATRGADCQSAPTCDIALEVLQILAGDYHRTLARCQTRRRKHLINWLHTEVVLFRDCIESKLHFFELVSIDVPLRRGETLYAQGDSVGAFYIVRSGRIRFEVNIQYEKTHRWPIAKHQWTQQVHTSRARIAFHVEEGTGFFGYEMFVDTTERLYTAIADTAAEVVALNRVDCFSPYFSFTPRAIDRIVERHNHCRELAARLVHDKLREYQMAQIKPKEGDRERLPVFVEKKFSKTSEGPAFQFPCLVRSSWDAPNETVRSAQMSCD